MYFDQTNHPAAATTATATMVRRTPAIGLRVFAAGAAAAFVLATFFAGMATGGDASGGLSESYEPLSIASSSKMSPPAGAGVPLRFDGAENGVSNGAGAGAGIR